MKTTLAIFLLITGVVLIIGGMLATNPQVPEASPTLSRIPSTLAPWLLSGGALTSLLGMLGLIGVFGPRHIRPAH